jgi:hypothetical protein
MAVGVWLRPQSLCLPSSTIPTAAAQLAAILDTLHGHRVRPDDIGQPRLARQGYERHAIRECCGPLLEDGLPE